ncbi:MAG: hypothetical protein HRT72_09960 [Flavobacteriales bacterium]|nr:hypothetical protein [Flavobacteriales bacterium]
MMFKKELLFFLFATLLLQFSCKRDLTIPSWEADVMSPLVSTSLKIGNLLTDTLVQTESDSSLTIVYQQDLFTLRIDTLLEIEDTSYSYVAKLDSIEITDFSAVDSITLSEIGTSNPLFGFLLASLVGDPLTPAEISAFQNLSFSNYVDFSSFFESATFNEGELTMEITNDLPLDIENITIELQNASDGSVFGSVTIPLIEAYGTSSDVIPLAGQYVEGEIIFNVISFDLTSDCIPVCPTIELEDGIIFSLTQSDLDIESATAIFPEQSIIYRELETSFGLDGLWLNEVTVKTGNFVFNIVNTLEDTLFLEYVLPNSWDSNGNLFRATAICPPKSIVDSVFTKLDGFTLDLTGQNLDKINTMYHILEGNIKYTGEITSLSKQDSVEVYFSIQDIVPEHAVGHILNDIHAFGPNTVDLDLFNQISNSPINALSFSSINLDLEISNEIGVNISASITNITSTNDNNNSSFSTSLDPVSVASPEDNLPIVPLTSYLIFPNNDARGIIETIPNQISYSAQVEINPLATITPPSPQNSGTDFIYYGSGISTKLNLNIPLNVIAQGLVLSDTVNFTMERNENLSKIENGSLNLIIDNGFPIEANVQIYLMNNSNVIIDSLFASKQNIQAAVIDMSTNKVEDKMKSELFIPLSKEKIDNLYETYKMMIFVDFSTSSSSTGAKIYSDYGIDVKVVGDFTYPVDDAIK